jgi:crotonobetainyl-CoA:carnitine CoA-transferase CaiB-like acyl-CoA transferase
MIDACLQDFLKQQPLEKILEKWAALGIPVAPVTQSTKVSEHPQFVARHFFEEVEHPIVGKHRFVTNPLRFQSINKWIKTPAPVVGEHNHELLSGILGMSENEIKKLEKKEIIGTQLKGLE